MNFLSLRENSLNIEAKILNKITKNSLKLV